MATKRPRKIPDLPPTTTASNTDLVVVERVANSSSTTSKMTVHNFRKLMTRGPYANDSAANTAGVAVGEMYYSSDGSVKVRIS